VGNKKSLRYLISKYAIIELVYSFFIVVLFYVGLNVLLKAAIKDLGYDLGIDA